MEKNQAQTIKRIRPAPYVAAVFVAVIVSLCAGPVMAADLSLSPASGNYDSNFNVTVYVSSPSRSINAVSGVISFPKDKLNIASISKAGSIVSIWVQEPTFSNTTGTLTFEGIALNPGYNGNFGNIVTINFKGVGIGPAAVKFTSGSVLANDGNGTNVLDNFGSANYSIGAAVPSASTKNPVAAPAPAVTQKPKTALSGKDQESQANFWVIGGVFALLLVAFALFVWFIILYRRRKHKKSVHPSPLDQGIDALSQYFSRIKQAHMHATKKLMGIRSTIQSSPVLNPYIMSLQALNEAKAQKIHHFHSSLSGALKNKVSLFEHELEQLKSTNAQEDQVLAILSQKLTDKSVIFERDLERLYELSKSKEQQLNDLAEKMELKLKNRINPFRDDIKELRENSVAAKEELAKLQQIVGLKTASLQDDVKELKEMHAQKDINLQQFRGELQNKLSHRIHVFAKDLERLKETNAAEDAALMRLEEKLSSQNAIFEKDLENLKELYAAKEADLTRFEAKMNSELKNKLDMIQHVSEKAEQEHALLQATMENKSALLAKDIEQLKTQELVKGNELTRIENKLESRMENVISSLQAEIGRLKENDALKSDLSAVEARLDEKLENRNMALNRTIQQLRDMTVIKEELSRIEERFDLKMETVTNALKADIVHLKESEEAKKDEMVKLKDALVGEFEYKNALFQKDIQQLKDAEEAKTREILQLSNNLGLQLENKTAAFEKTVQQLQEEEAHKQAELTSIGTNVRKLLDDQKLMRTREDELKEKIARINDSLKALNVLYANVISQSEEKEE